MAVHRTNVGLLAIAILFAIILTHAAPARAADIVIGYIGEKVDIIPFMPVEPQPPPADEGIQGARLAIDDSNTTGRFLGQHFTLVERRLDDDSADAAAALADLHAQGIRFVVSDLRAAHLDRLLTAPVAKDMLIINAGAADERFRNQDCRPFLLHTLPDRAMLADALGQFLVKKRWTDWFIVRGEGEADALFAAAVRRAAKRFGANVVAEKTWKIDQGGQRTDAEEIPIFTQNVGYDVLIVADEAGAFGDEFPFRTWDPRPVAGTQGLVVAAWHPTLEQWAAAQLQSRFRKFANRWMTPRDYAAWTAVRTVGEAASMSKAADYPTLHRTIRADTFEMAAFKGRKLSYRTWDGQLRQPIPLAWPRALVSMSPQEGFLHPATDLDTLGTDKPETRCKGFGEAIP